jgi:predicted Rossmann fold flavoprotein
LIKSYDLVILGAGASALMLASYLSQKGCRNILLIDHNPKPGQKIKISGGGKCNVTNEEVSEDNYLGEPGFVASVLSRYTPQQLLDFLKQKGVVPKIRSLGQYFCTKSADEVIGALRKDIKTADFLLSHEIIDVVKDEAYTIHTDKTKVKAKHLVIATGSSAYPQVGGSDIGLRLAKELGHNTEPFVPVLVGWTVQKDQFWMKELSGISSWVSIDVGHKKLFGDLLFAHKGISGPAVLSASLYWKKGQVRIDFLPNSSLKDALRDRKKQISTQLQLPKRLIKLLLENIDVKDQPVQSLSSQEYEKLSLLKAYPMAPAGNFGLKKAEACRGGVQTSEIDVKTMQSILHENLYFIGEVVDVTGELGGYNFQWAFASAVVCAQALEKKLLVKI